MKHAYFPHAENECIPHGTFLIGHRLMGTCDACGKIVRINKPILGSAHICTLPDVPETKK